MNLSDWQANILSPRQNGQQTMASWLNAGYVMGPGSLYIGPTEDKSFQGFDLAVGEVYGLRTWKIDKLGRLGALHISDAPKWRPGVNTAVCKASSPQLSITRYDDGRPDKTNVIDPSGAGRKAIDVKVDRKVETDGGYGGMLAPHITSTRNTYRVTWDDGETATYSDGEIKFGRHAAPTESCKCGFYAYSDPDSDDVLDPGADFVLGVIKGTGRTLVGTKGFRTEKAEIVALLDPTRGGAKTAGWRTKQRDLLTRVYPDVPLIEGRKALIEFAPIVSELPDPSTDEFWEIPS